MQCRVAGALRMILVGDRRSEKRHDSIARVLVDGSLEAVDSLGQDREEAIHDPVPLFGIYLLGEIHRALHVREQHGYLLSLAFEGGARSKDLLGEMLWGVGARVAFGQRDTGGKSGASLCIRPYEDLA